MKPWFKNTSGPFLQIVLLCISGSVIYGICHDLITANIAVEYFTVHHPRIVVSESPFVMALIWGFIATWWVGAFFGLILAIASRVGDLPKHSWRDLIRPIVWLLSSVFVLSMSIGIVAYVAIPPKGTLDPTDGNLRMIAVVGIIHSMSYLLNTAGGILLIFWALRKRLTMLQPTSTSVKSSSVHTNNKKSPSNH